MAGTEALSSLGLMRLLSKEATTKNIAIVVLAATLLVVVGIQESRRSNRPSSEAVPYNPQGGLYPVKLTWNELTVAPSDHTPAVLLSEWRWLLGDTFQIVLISSLGDMFLSDSAGHIHWLDTGAGRLTEIASSLGEFQKLRQQPAKAAEWFAPQLVGDILQSGARLTRDQCFGYKVPPALGGQMEPSNFEPTDLAVHFGILGQIHEQIKDLPEGTPIGEIKFK
jgi:hypothetical protein